ncbi:MAG: glycosyltransferase [Helicobacter sp.]|nr:glycosyltransferase [Helicobacter sp.]
MKPFFSVIIPIYNAESYLHACLYSCLNQSFRDVEFILINDGSTDNSLKIAQHYAQNDDRIKLFSQENKGLSQARNKSLNEASGEYVIFLDSDDLLSEGYFKRAHQLLVDPISFLCEAQNFSQIQPKKPSNNKNPKIDVLKLHKDTPCENVEISLSEGRAYLKKQPWMLETGCVWLFICRLSFLRENKIEFIPNILYEDMSFIAQIMLDAKVFLLSDIYCYHYTFTPNSIMNGKMHPKKALRSLISYFSIMHFYYFLSLKEKDYDIKYLLETHVYIYARGFIFWRMSDMPKQYFFIIKNILKYRKIIRKKAILLLIFQPFFKYLEMIRSRKILPK